MTKTVIRYKDIGGDVYEVSDDFPIYLPFTDVPPVEGVPLKDQKFDSGKGEWIVLRYEVDKLTAEAKEVIAIAIQSADLSNEQTLAVAEFYDEWQPGMELEKGRIVRHEGVLYRTTKDMTTEAHYPPGPGMESLYTQIQIGDDGVQVWKAPTGGHDAFNTGDRVKHNDTIWISKIDANTTEPSEENNRWWDQE